MVTLTEVAKLSGVSASTVSNILNGKTNVGEATKARVLKVIEETGYEPNYFASSMRKRSTKMVGIVVEDLTIYTMPIVERCMSCLEDAGYKTILSNLRMYDKWHDTWYYDETRLVTVLKNAMAQFRSVKVDGVVYIGGHCRYLRVFSEFSDMKIVVAYAIAKDENIPSVIIDDEKGGYDVTRYLLDMGHTKIGVIGGAEENLHTQKRLAGYQKAMFEHGLLFNPEMVAYGNWIRTSGYELAPKVLKHNPTALFCMNDYMAAGVYDYCREKGIRIPEDLSIVGYDDIELSWYLVPELTTCQIRSGSIGEQAAERMVNLLNKDEDEASTTGSISKVECEMIYRGSVKQMN